MTNFLVLQYIFLLYKQAGRLNIHSPSDHREKWNVQAWANQHYLSNPIAAHFFYAETK